MNFILRFSALQLFQLMRFMTTLVIGILLAKVFHLSTGEIALYEMLLFLGSFFSFFWTSAGIKSLLSLYPKVGLASAELIFNLALLLLLLGIITGSILYFGQNWIVRHFTSFQRVDHIGLISLILIASSPAALTEYVYLLEKKESLLITYGLVTYGLQLSILLTALYFQTGVEGIFKGLLLWSIIRLCWFLILLSRTFLQSKQKKKRLRISLKFQKMLLWLIFPLSLHMLVGGGMEYIDGFIVSGYFDEEGVFAVFRYGAREFPLVLILTSALTATLIPAAVLDQEGTAQNLKAETDRLSLMLYPASMVLMLLSSWLFPLVYNENFAASAPVFNIYLLVISSRILLPQVFIYARQDNYVLVISALAEVALNLVLSLYLVRDYGLEGIAFATVIAYMINKLILIAYTQFQLGVPVTAYVNVRRYLFFNALLMACFLIQN